MKATSSIKRSIQSLAGAALVAVLASAASTSALAGDVYWSVGLSVPGVQVGVVSPQPVYVSPQPSYVQYGQVLPVYSQPQVIYTQPRPVYVQPRPVYLQPQPVVVYNGWHHARHGWHDRPRLYPQQVVQTYPVRYQTVEPLYGHGERLR
jgi:hypothetical protein